MHTGTLIDSELNLVSEMDGEEEEMDGMTEGEEEMDSEEEEGEGESIWEDDEEEEEDEE
jgi:hypothetical protein